MIWSFHGLFPVMLLMTKSKYQGIPRAQLSASTWVEMLFFSIDRLWIVAELNSLKKCFELLCNLNW